MEIAITVLIVGALVLVAYVTDKVDKRRKEEGRR